LPDVEGTPKYGLVRRGMNFGRGLLDIFWLARANCELCALAREFLGDGATQPLTCCSDDGDAAP
jgi:hypothetical protein